MTLEFTIPGKAVPLARPRFTRNGYAYLPKKSRDYRTYIQKCALAKFATGFTPLTGALSIAITEIRRKPKSSKNAEPITRPDLDNVIKAVLDALNGLVWNDDAQVTVIEAKKRYGTPEGVHIKVTDEARE